MLFAKISEALGGNGGFQRNDKSVWQGIITKMQQVLEWLIVVECFKGYVMFVLMWKYTLKGTVSRYASSIMLVS